MSMKRVTTAFAGVAALAMTAAVPGLAQAGAHEDWPNKTVRYVLHASAGGGTDVMARILAGPLERELGQTVVVENRTGGQFGNQMAHIIASDTDGYTIGATTGSIIGVLNTTFDQWDIDNFTWITSLVFDSVIYVTRPDSPFDDMAEFIEAIKENPGRYSVAGTFEGSLAHIAWEMLATDVGIDTVRDVSYIPYDGMGEGVTGAVGGHHDVAVAWPGIVLDHIEAGNLKVLAVHSDQRLAEMPDVPTLEELGFNVPGAWQQMRGIYGPRGMDPDLVRKIRDAFHAAAHSSEFSEWAANANLTLRVMEVEDFQRFVRENDALTKEWVERLGLAN